jgi:hypothetical protein
VIVYTPVGVDDVVLTVKVLENVGLPELGLKPHDANMGRPSVQDKSTCSVGPLTAVAVIEFCPDAPCVTAMSPSFDNEKSNVGVAMVYSM